MGGRQAVRIRRSQPPGGHGSSLTEHLCWRAIQRTIQSGGTRGCLWCSIATGTWARLGSRNCSKACSDGRANDSGEIDAIVWRSLYAVGGAGLSARCIAPRLVEGLAQRSISRGERVTMTTTNSSRNWKIRHRRWPTWWRASCGRKACRNVEKMENGRSFIPSLIGRESWTVLKYS